MVDYLWQHSQTVKTSSPLVHNFTNFEVMNNTANVLLTAGALPIMVHAHAEVNSRLPKGVGYRNRMGGLRASGKSVS